MDDVHETVTGLTAAELSTVVEAVRLGIDGADDTLASICKAIKKHVTLPADATRPD